MRGQDDRVTRGRIVADEVGGTAEGEEFLLGVSWDQCFIFHLIGVPKDDDASNLILDFCVELRHGVV